MAKCSRCKKAFEPEPYKTCEACREYIRQWNQKNLDWCEEYSRQWRRNNIDRYKEYSRQWKRDNNDRLKEYSRQWRRDNHDRLKEYARQRYQRNPDRYNEYSRQWYQRNVGGCGLYRLVCVPTGDIYYGSSTRLRQCEINHYSLIRQRDHENPKIRRLSQTYGGDDFKFEILAYCVAEDLLCFERVLIEELPNCNEYVPL